jgi:uncharacterized protein YjbI with pentapeptide repeats
VTTQFQELLTQPFVPWLILLVIAVAWVLNQVETRVPNDPFELFKKKLNIAHWPHILVLAPILAWLTLFSLLFFGLCTVIADIIWNVTMPKDGAAQGDFRFLLTKTAALTAVLGALVALPFTVYRLKLTTEQNRHNENVLFNEKLHQANNDLHAMRQVTKEGETIWEDDIIRRNGAIDRLEALAVERPAMAPRIGRILCVYVKELSRDYRAAPAPKDLDMIVKWSRSLTVKRSDMQSATQALGRMPERTGVPPATLAIDLCHANLQAMDLHGLNFQQAQLDFCNLDGANLYETKLNEAKLNVAKLKGAILIRAELNRTELNRTELNGAKLNGSILIEAILDGVVFDMETELTSVSLDGAALRNVDLSGFPEMLNALKLAFGDASVKFSPPLKAGQRKN